MSLLIRLLGLCLDPCCCSGGCRSGYWLQHRRLGRVSPTLLPVKLPKLGAGRGESKNCEVHLSNLTVPLLRKLCAYYAQDYVCFQYALPEACR